MRRFYQNTLIFLLRPYISRELPGWGYLYRAFIGDYTADARWRGRPPRWIRGKLHQYEMFVDLSQWTNRSTFFLKRLYDLPTQLLLKKLLHEGDLFVDVGANEGMISILAARLVGPTGKVISFEPNPKPRSIFQATIDRNQIKNIDLIPVGLGYQDGTLSLSVPKINTGEGTFGRSNYPDGLVEVIACEIRRGDDLLRDQKPKVIKIDVEGFELYALRGLEKTLSTAWPLVITEVITSHLANSGTSVSALVSFMTSKGYQPFKIGLKRRSFRHIVALTSEMVPSDVEDDFLWVHSSNCDFDSDSLSV